MLRLTTRPLLRTRHGLACRPPLRLLSTKTEAAGQTSGMNHRHAGGVPDFIEKWGPGPFRQVGYGLAALSAASLPLSFSAANACLLEKIAVKPVPFGAPAKDQSLHEVGACPTAASSR